MNVRNDTFDLYTGQTLSAANQNSQAIEVGSYTEAVITINVTAISGTSPTVDLDIEISDDNGTTWFKHEDITQLTAVGKTVHRVTAPFGSRLRLNDPAVPGGSSTPTITLTVRLMVKGS